MDRQADRTIHKAASSQLKKCFLGIVIFQNWAFKSMVKVTVKVTQVNYELVDTYQSVHPYLEYSYFKFYFVIPKSHGLRSKFKVA